MLAKSTMTRLRSEEVEAVTGTMNYQMAAFHLWLWLSLATAAPQQRRAAKVECKALQKGMLEIKRSMNKNQRPNKSQRTGSGNITRHNLREALVAQASQDHMEAKRRRVAQDSNDSMHANKAIEMKKGEDDPVQGRVFERAHLRASSKCEFNAIVRILNNSAVLRMAGQRSTITTRQGVQPVFVNKSRFGSPLV